MKIQKTLTIAYEAAEHYGPIPHALKMLGTEALYDEFPDIKYAHINSETNSFISIFDLDHNFYYRIDRIHKGDSIANEVGLGELVENSGNIVMLRTQPMYVTAVGEDRRAAYGTKPLNFTAVTDTLMVTSYIPMNVVEALPDPNMIITSLGDHHPHPLKVEEGSVIGRKQDGTIDSIKFNELPAIAPKVEDAPAEEGSIAYDPEAKTLKFYNGTEWRVIGE